MTIFSREDNSRHLSSDDLPPIDDDGMPLQSVRAPAPPKQPGKQGPDIGVLVGRISLYAYITPGPYSDAEKAFLLAGLDHARAYIEEQSEKDQPRIGRGAKLALSEQEAAE